MSRAYTKSENLRFKPDWGFWESDDGASFKRTFTFSQTAQLQSSVSGYTLPNYKTLIASGQNATTPLTAYRRNVVSNIYPNYEWFSIITKKIYKATYFGLEVGDTLSDGGANATISGISQAAYDKAVAQARSACVSYIRKRQTPFQTQVFLGESREILELLRDPLGQAKNLILPFHDKWHRFNRKGDRRRSEDAAIKGLASSWLQLQFALLPLIGDINRIIELYNQNVEKIERSRFYGEATGPTSVSSILTYNAGAWTAQRRIYRTSKVECFIRSGILFEKLTAHEGLKDYLADSLFDITNAVPTAYELTGYSFLLDYFANIGDIISAATVGKISMNYSSESIVITNECRQVVERIIPSAGTTVISGLDQNSMPEITFRRRSVSRNTITSLVPPLTFTLPTTGVRYANIAALITSKIQNLRSLP
jgi:hypothetical protein